MGLRPALAGTPRNVHGSGTHTAAHHFVRHLEDSSTSLGYKRARDAKILEIVEDGGTVGHVLVLPAPPKGFSDFQKDRFEAYGKSLAMWRQMLVTFEWGADSVTINFRESDEVIAEAATAKDPWVKSLFEKKTYRAARSMGRLLSEQGFMTREPTPASLVMLKQEFAGFALLFKYPGSREGDQAGVHDAYDRWIPLLADVLARDWGLKAEVLANGELITAFFTANKNYVPSLYDTVPALRLIVPRKAKAGFKLAFVGPTFRACRALAKHYKKHFVIQRKPLTAWGVEGHSLIMEYKRGAGGKVIDDSYIRNVSLVSEKLMAKYGLRCFIQHQPQARALLVTFFTGQDPHGNVGVQQGAPTPYISETNTRRAA